MILDVLRSIVHDKMVYKKAIAKKVGIQTETLDDILRLLVERGYLKKQVSPSSDSKCATCPIHGTCHDEGNDVTYYVTERGRRAIE